MNYAEKLRLYEAGHIHVLTESELKFFDFISANMDFLDHYMRIVREVVMAGKRRYRSQLILYKMRYDMRLKYDNKNAPWRIDDHYSRPMALLVRDLGLVPTGFFEFRESGKIEREARTREAGKWLA